MLPCVCRIERRDPVDEGGIRLRDTSGGPLAHGTPRRFFEIQSQFVHQRFQPGILLLRKNLSVALSRNLKGLSRMTRANGHAIDNIGLG